LLFADNFIALFDFCSPNMLLLNNRKREGVTMKLAEALILRADLQVRISQLQRRLTANARMQEGEAPAEDPAKLFAELDACVAQLEKLVKNINKTNAATLIGKKTISDLIAEKDCLGKKQNAYQDFRNSASGKVDRYSKNEIRILSTLDVSSVQKQIDAMAKQYRELDTKLQGANWATDLIE